MRYDRGIGSTYQPIYGHQEAEMNHIINQLNRELTALAAYPGQRRLAAEIGKMNRAQGEAEELAGKWRRRAEGAETTEAAAEAREAAEKYAAEAQELGRQMAAARIELAGGRNRSAALIYRQIRDNPEWQAMHSARASDIRELAELAVGDAAEAMLTELADWEAHNVDIDAAAESGNWPSPISDNLAAKCAAESPARAAIIYVGARRRRAVARAIRAHRGGGHRGGLISPEPLADCRATCEAAEAVALRNIAYAEYRSAARAWRSQNQSPAHREAAEAALRQAVAHSAGELEMDGISENQRRAIRRQYPRRREIAIAAGIGSEADWGGAQRQSSPPPQ